MTREPKRSRGLPLLGVLATTLACSGTSAQPSGPDEAGTSGSALGGKSAVTLVGHTGGVGATETNVPNSRGGEGGERSPSTSSRSLSGGDTAYSSANQSSTRTTAGTGSGGKSVSGGATSSTGGRNQGGTSSIASTLATGGRNRGGTSSTAGTVAAGGTSTTTGTANAVSPILAPENGALLGLYYGDESIAATTTKIGRQAPVHLTYYAWEDDWTEDITLEDFRQGRIPFVNWELFGVTLDAIIAGTEDRTIAARAVSAKALGKKFFLDFGAEMNGDWSPWGGPQNGNSATKFLSAYRHVHDIFVREGASNVIWTFCPNVTSVPDTTWNEPLDYYPGDDYVDWTCVDGYNWGTSEAGGKFQSFGEVFRQIYAVLATKKKPIMIGEMASTELGGSKAEFISGIVPTLKKDFPLIKGLIWFDINKETDWRISSSAASTAAFKAMANDPWFVR